MKKKTMRVLTAALAMALLTGCGTAKTDTPAETSVNQAMLIEKSAGPQESGYTFPEKFTGEWVSQEGRLTIRADAQVVAELGTELPTATVEPREFTQEDVDNLLKVFLKGEPLYGFTLTKQECQDAIDYTNSDQWHGDPDAPEQTPEEIEQRRQNVIAYYTEQMKTAPEEKPIIHGFSDSGDPDSVSGTATVDGKKYVVLIWNDLKYGWRMADITLENYKYRNYDIQLPEVSKEEAIVFGNTLIRELGFDSFVLDDAQPMEEGLWWLHYAPTVDGVPVSGVRVDRVETNDGNVYKDFSYWSYAASEESEPDTVSWHLEGITMDVGKDGVLAFRWKSPSTQPVVQQTSTALLPFSDIAAIADTMLPEVIQGPDGRVLVEVDQYNGFETRMDVDISKVSLSLMRVRDKGSLLGTIVPVWDFWGTSDWYDVEPNAYGYMEKGMNYDFQPMLTLNAVDGTVVDRQLGY